MAYNVSNDWITKSYSGESLYSCRLSINNKVVPITQISKIDINSPIIDNSSQDKPFYIGTFISQSITIKFRNLKGLNITSGARVDLYIGQTVGDNDTYEEVPIGRYLIDELAENYEQTCEITCLDYGVLCSTNCDYSSALDTNTGDIEIDDLFEWICNYYGLEFEPYPSINGTVKVGSYDSTQSGKFYLSCIAEIKGCNVKMSRLGKVALIPIKSSPTRTIDALKSKSWELGEKYVIKKVTYFDAIRNYSFGMKSYGLNYQDNPLYYEGIRLGFIADKGNELIIRQDNPFITDEQVVENIYNEVKDLEIWSLKCENYGDLSLDAWDIVTYTLGEESYNTFYNNTTTYEMTVMSTNNVQIPNKQQEVTTNVVGGTQEQKIRRVSTEVNNIDGRVTILAEEQDETARSLSELELTVEGIETEVEKIAKISNTISGTGSITLEKAYQGILHNLTIKGQISLLYPQNENDLYGNVPFGNEILYPSNALYTQDTILLIDDNEYKLDLNFLNYINNDICDEFIYEDGKCHIIRRVGIDSNGMKYELENEIIEEKEDIILEVDSNSTISLKSFNNAILGATYLLENQYTENFATQVEVNSQITQTADSINLEVSKKVNGDEVVSTINQSPEQITLTANRLVVDSDNFKLTSDGNLTSKAGTIAGLTINDEGFENYAEETFNLTSADLTTISNIIMSSTDPTEEELQKYDFTGDRVINTLDLTIANRIVNGSKPNTMRSKFEINADSLREVLTITDVDDNLTGMSLSSRGGYFKSLGFETLSSRNGAYQAKMDAGGVQFMDRSTNEDTYVSASYIDTPTLYYQNLVPSSLEQKKKDFEKLKNAKQILKDTDIYKFHYNNEDKDYKKHIGFIIGDKFNYSKDITSNQNNGADLYSMISVLWQVCKEQQEEIDDLRKEINLLKEDKNVL